MAAKSKNTLPISVEELEKQMLSSIKAGAQAVATYEPQYASANIIRVKNKNFLFEDEKLPQPLEVVVLTSAFGQFYYESDYVEGESTPPVCFALSDDPRVLVPHDTAPKKQHERCDTCHQNQKGSAGDGSFRRACSARRRLAILLLSDKSDDPAIGSIEISASGLRPFSKYAQSVAAIHGTTLAYVVTKLSVMDTKKETWYVGAEYGGLLTRAKPQWVSPSKGVKIGSEGWLETTTVGRKLAEVLSTKQLLTPPSLAAPVQIAKKPVTGHKRVSVKDAKAARRGKAA